MRQYFWERKRLYSWTGTGWHYTRVYLIGYVEHNRTTVMQQGYYDSKKKAKRAVAYYNRKEEELCQMKL
jgi:hypothetical protein